MTRIGEAATSDDDEQPLAMRRDSEEPSTVESADERIIMTKEEVRRKMEQCINDVAQVAGISKGASRILLTRFKWNKESLLERYYEHSDADSFLAKCHINPDRRKSGDKSARSSTAECPICCASTSLIGFACDHVSCSACWEKYLANKVLVSGVSEVECVFAGCHRLLDDDSVRSILRGNALALSTLDRLMVNSFVEGSRQIRWCPAPDCQQAVMVSHAEARPVRCACGFRFCFECGQQWHEPVNCRLLKLWLKKCAEDSETSNWINTNTKECPKCNAVIVKDGGCNHMTCKNVACRNEFCWVCLGPWRPHGQNNYTCNRFDDTASKQARDAQDKSRAELQRYLHYYNRYANHQQSLRLENKLYTLINSKMDQMQQCCMSWIEVQFLRKAVDVLSECRKTLMHTYAFAYYLRRDNHALIFEDNQKDLEHATEQLSEFLERDLDNAQMVTLKQLVQDKSNYCSIRRKILLNHCKEGVEKDFWGYTQ